MIDFVFYSIKGGTGRSLSLANVALLLARTGKRIGCVDFDLMAPGLMPIFGFKEEDLIDYPSVTDVLLNPDNISLVVKSFVNCAERFGFSDGSNGALFSMFSRGESKQKYSELSKRQTLSVLGMTSFQKTLKHFEITKNLDYLLIDAKSGFSQESMVTLTLSSSKYLVFFTRLDTQSRENTYHFFNILQAYGYSMFPIVVATNVPEGNRKFKVNDGVEFLVSQEAAKILSSINKRLEIYNSSIHCIIPFDQQLILDHKLYPLLPSSKISQTFKGLELLSNILINIGSENAI